MDDLAGFATRRMIPLRQGAVCVLEIGPASGPLALLLHGFPDTPGTWRHLAPALAARGYRVVAPYLRGYAPTEVAATRRAGAAALGEDANALHEWLAGGDANAILIGHDWGAAAAYAVAGSGRWRRVVASSWPPFPADIDAASYEQMRRSWYVFLFQLPIAEALVMRGEFELIDRLWLDWSPSLVSGEDRRRAKAALAEPGCLRYVLECYRSLFQGESPPLSFSAPILYLHGAEDGCIGPEFACGLTPQLPPGSRVSILQGAGHFPQLEQPAAFVSDVLDFL